MATAQSFLMSLLKRDITASRIAPSVMGGIGLTQRQSGRNIYIEFYNDGRVFALFSDGVSEPMTREVAPGYQDFNQLIGEMQGFLDA